MTEPAKFLFDRNFDSAVALQDAQRSADEAERSAAQAELERRNVAELAEAQRLARETGFAEGRQAEAETVEARIAAALEALLDQADGATRRMTDEIADLRGEAIALASSMADTLAGALLSREPTAELEALFTDCIDQISDAPHIAVRVHETLIDPIRTRLTARAAERGFTGKLVVLGDPEISVGDGRIEWADGGIARDTAEVRRQIDALIRRYVGVRGRGPVANGREAADPTAQSDGGALQPTDDQPDDSEFAETAPAADDPVTAGPTAQSDVGALAPADGQPDGSERAETAPAASDPVAADPTAQSGNGAPSPADSQLEDIDFADA